MTYKKRSFKDVQGELEKLPSATSDSEYTYFKPKTGNDGTNEIMIRFLPPPDGSLGLVSYYQHIFKNSNTNKWYFEKCRSTLNDKDPVEELNEKLLSTGQQYWKNWVDYHTKRKTICVGNILVHQDIANPENNGKVFLWNIPFTIYQILYTQLASKCDVFDLENGKNLHLKVFKNKGKNNYSKSYFRPIQPLHETTENVDDILKQTVNLQQFKDPSTFLDYNQLKAKMIEILGTDHDCWLVADSHKSTMNGTYNPNNTFEGFQH